MDDAALASLVSVLPDDVQMNILRLVGDNGSSGKATNTGILLSDAGATNSAATTSVGTRDDDSTADPHAEPLGEGGEWEFSSLNGTSASLLSRLLTDGYAVVDDWLGGGTASSLVEEVVTLKEDGVLSPGGMSETHNKWSDASVRGDLMTWLKDEHWPHAVRALQKSVHSLVARLTRPAGVSLTARSPMITCYPPGARYVKHRDASVLSPARKITVLYYANEGWTPEAGGCLRLYPTSGGEPVTVDPLLDRLLIFFCDVEHEVLESHADRYAITTWFRSEDLDAVEVRARMEACLARYTSGVSDVDPTNDGNAQTAAAAVVDSSVGNTGTVTGVDTDTNTDTDTDAGTDTGTDVIANTTEVINAASAAAATPTNQQTIFVAIPSYRDPECQHTIYDLFSKAAHPERVYVGVCFQNHDEDDADCDRVSLKPNLVGNVTEVRYAWTEAKGPCWARAQANSLYSGQDYVLQIDSHTRMIADWDCELIAQLHEAGQTLGGDGSSVLRPILTGYPLGYTVPDRLDDETRPVALYATHFDEDGMLRIAGKKVTSTSGPYAGNASDGNGDCGSEQGLSQQLFWVAGFSFSVGSVVTDCPYDPNLPFLFFGEEASMSARLYTHGYRFFRPRKSVVYHLWTREGRPVFWELGESESEGVAESVHAQRHESQEKVKQLLSGDPSACGDYGFGSVSTLTEYQEFCGVDFRALTIV